MKQLDGRTKEGKEAKELARQRRNEYHRNYRANMTERQSEHYYEQRDRYRAENPERYREYTRKWRASKKLGTVA